MVNMEIDYRKSEMTISKDVYDIMILIIISIHQDVFMH